METLLKIVQTVNSYLSDYILIVMLVAAGLFFSIKTRFVQVRYFGAAMRIRRSARSSSSARSMTAA